jgi:hypothetical protein
MEISSVAFKPVPGMGTSVTFVQFYVDMGYCSSDELGPNYDNNYVSGTKTRVFSRNSSYTVTATSPWTPLVLDTPFYYIPASGNLIIDIAWPDAEGEFYSYNFTTPGLSSVGGAYGEATGDTFNDMPQLLIEGVYSMGQMTFAGIKATFR